MEESSWHTKLKYSFSRHTDEIKLRLSCVNLEFEH